MQWRSCTRPSNATSKEVVPHRETSAVTVKTSPMRAAACQTISVFLSISSQPRSSKRGSSRRSQTSTASSR